MDGKQKFKISRKDLKANWSSCSVSFKKQKIKNKKFDEGFGSYSYFEDLDFSLLFKPLYFLIVSKGLFFSP